MEKTPNRGERLILRHASKRKLGTRGPDDYDVIDAQGRHIGRIGGTPRFRPVAG
jgi:hypothetical protein